MTSLIDDNGNSLDYSGEDFLLIKQAFSLLSFQIKGDVSTNFKIVNHSRNRQALGFYGDAQVNNPFLSQIAFNVVRDGNLISRGFIVVQNVDEFIECYYIAGNSAWFNDFQFDIRDVDLSDFATPPLSVWDYTYINSRKSSTDGMVFPFIDWGYNRRKGGAVNGQIYSDIANYYAYIYAFDTENNTISDFYPCFYLKSLLDYTFRKANYKLAGNLLNDGLYLSTVITPNTADAEYSDSFISSKTANLKLLGDQAITGGVTTTINFINQTPVGMWSDVTHNYTADSQYEFVVTVNIYTSLSQSYSIYTTVLILGPTTSDTLIGSTGGSYYKGQSFAITINGASNFNVLQASTATITLKKKIRPNGYVQPVWFLPSMKAVDLIKAVAIRYGCVVNYSDKTINFNILDQITASEDWSAYLVSYKSVYQEGFKNNIINVAQSDEFNSYDVVNEPDYGGGNISTDFTINQQRDLYTDPFGPALDGIATYSNKWLQPYIPLISYSDDSSFAFTSVSDDGFGFAQLNGTFTLGIADVAGIVRIDETNGFYSGFHQIQSVSATTIVLFTYFTFNTSGTVFKQSVSLNSPGSRLLINVPAYTLSNIANIGSALNIMRGLNTAAINNQTTWPFAYFAKPKTGRLADRLKRSLSYGPINLEGYSDSTITDDRYRKVKTMFNGPIKRCMFRLPEAVFNNFAFDRFIYLTCEDFTGYFWVDKINGYKDALTPVEADLYFVHG